jgi:glycerate 2-kinase
MPHLVASGPTLPDPTTQAQASAVLEQYKIKMPEYMRAWLTDPAQETPKPGDNRFANDRSKVIASGMNALDAAAAFAKKNNVTPIILGTDIEGEAREVGASHVAECHKHFGGKAFVILSGGETTVTITGTGKGGRNSEYILGAALAAQGKAHIYGLAAGTDGLDGNGGCAGAFFTPATLAAAAKKGMDPKKFLTANDTASFFAALDSQVITGPTRTNVTDLRAILVV